MPAQIAALAADNDDDVALGVARRKKGPVPKLLSNEKCKGIFLNFQCLSGIRSPPSRKFCSKGGLKRQD